MRKYNCNEDYFEIIDTEEKAYWLGFLYADGNLYFKSNKYGNLRLKLAKKDREHIEIFSKCLESNNPIKNGISNIKYKGEISSSEFSQISIWNTKLCNDLIDKGCLLNKTFKLTFPNLDSNLINHFIRGYFDGDGTISVTKNSKREGKFQTSSSIIGTEIFLIEIKNILKDNGINCNIHKSGNIFRLELSQKNNGLINFKLYLYNNATIYLSRKKNLFDKLKIKNFEEIKRNKAIKRTKYKIIQLNLDNTLVRVWECMDDILKENKFTPSHIYRCCNNKCETAYNFIWKFQKENL